MLELPATDEKLLSERETEDTRYLAAIVATFTIQAMICPPNVFTCYHLKKKNDASSKSPSV